MSVGLNGQLGWSKEVTKGSRVVPADFAELNPGESVQLAQEHLFRQGIRANAVTPHDVALGSKSAAGSFSLDLSAEVVGSLLELCVGDVDSTSGSGPYTHVYTPKAARKSATLQFGRPGTAGTVHPFDYTGCMVDSWTVACNSGEFATIEVGWQGRAEDTGQSLASASYAQATFFDFTQADVEIGSSEVPVRSISISGANEVRTDNPIASTYAGGARVLENGQSVITGELVMDFEDLTEHARYAAGTEATLDLVFTSGTSSLTFSGNVVFTGTTPVIGSLGILEQPLPFQFVPATPSGDAITITLVNDDSSP